MPRKIPRFWLEPPANSLPHSWPASRWVSTVHPCDTKKAKYLIRAHRRELIECGALVRIGRELVVIGAPYAAWIARKGDAVRGYEIAANRPRSTSTEAQTSP